MEKQQLIELYTYRVQDAIKWADSLLSKLGVDQFNVIGMSSTKVRIFMNQIIKPDSKYLEIGVWAGSTFVAALYDNNPLSAVAVDNFSEYEDISECTTKANKNDIESNKVSNAFFNNLKNNNITNFRFINSDCFDLKPEDRQSIKDINVYLYDGGHTEEDHRKSLTYYYDNLSDIFILIVDDWNDPRAKSGTKLGLEECGIKIHADFELPSNGNRDAENWWNGYYVAVCEKVKVTNE